MLSAHVPFLGKKTHKPHLFYLENGPLYALRLRGFSGSRAGTEARPGQGQVLGSVMGMSCDQAKPGTLLELLEKRFFL